MAGLKSITLGGTTLDVSPSFTTEGDWWYKINSDSTFEAYYFKSGVTLVITSASGNLYRSDLQTLVLPLGLTNGHNAYLRHVSVNASHNNYPTFGMLASVQANQFKYYAMSGGSRTSSPNYIVTAHVFGILMP